MLKCRPSRASSKPKFVTTKPILGFFELGSGKSTVDPSKEDDYSILATSHLRPEWRFGRRIQ